MLRHLICARRPHAAHCACCNSHFQGQCELPNRELPYILGRLHGLPCVLTIVVLITPQCFSANNFQSQHLANLHRPARPSGLVTVRDGVDSVHLLWRPSADASSPSPTTTGYRVRVSVDDGITWQTGIEDTRTSETRAIITNLIPGVQYRFQVAGVNCAGVGPESEPSPSLCISPAAPPVTSRVSDGLDLLSMAAANRLKDDGNGLFRPCASETKVTRSLSEGHCPANIEAIRHIGSFDVF